jgi:hypothetical protein
MQRTHDEPRPAAEVEAPSEEAADGADSWRYHVRGTLPPVAGEPSATRGRPTASDRAFGSGATHPAAQPWQRQLWQLANNHPLAQKLIGHYMDATGAALTLSATEMAACNPIVNIRRSKAFMALVDSLRDRGGGTANVDVNGLGGAQTNGTLGNFTIMWRGSVAVNADGSWSFSGSVMFHDVWDFDPKNFGEADRTFLAELKVRIANRLLPGKPFHIFSEQVDVAQSSPQATAWWGNGAPLGSHLDNPTFMLDSTVAGETIAGATAGASAPALAAGAAIGAAASGAVIDIALANRDAPASE